jgi:phosphoenolpyruvate carboxykinase (GTP)
MWPGYGENMRVLKWIIERARSSAHRVETPLGFMPAYEDIDWNGLDFTKEQFDAVMSIDTELWQKEIESQGEFFDKLGDRLPKELAVIREFLTARLGRAANIVEQPALPAEPLKAMGTTE